MRFLDQKVKGQQFNAALYSRFQCRCKKSCPAAALFCQRYRRIYTSIDVAQGALFVEVAIIDRIRPVP